MEIGRLSSQVTLQSPPSAQDDQGQPTGPWNVVTTLWADIKHTSGLQAIRGGVDTSLVKASIRIRWRAGVVAGWRIVWGSSAYNIMAVLPDSRRQYIDLVCEVLP